MKKIIVLGLLGICAILGYIVFSNYNNIPKLDENVKEKWSQVQNQYQRRADLIPNLVNTVKGYAKHEEETLTKVIEARSKVAQMNINAKDLNNSAIMKKFVDAQDFLSSALSRLMVVVERYPELKADKSFLRLQAQLEGTENRISVARRDFILAVKNYNLELRTFPGKLIAGIFHSDAKIRENFQTEVKNQKSPKVEF